MAVDPVSFPVNPAFSEFDFSPLGRLGKVPNDRTLADLGAALGSQQPATSATGSVSGGDTGAPFTGDRKDVARQVTAELKAQGFSDNAIAGILYNINQESTFNPNLRHPDQPRFGGEAHYAHGLFQEGGDEWNTYAAHLRSRGLDPDVWQDPTEQARFVAGRLKGDVGNAQYANVLRALQSAKTKEEAAKIFASGYLKPAQQYLNSRIANINSGIPGIDYYTGE